LHIIPCLLGMLFLYLSNLSRNGVLSFLENPHSYFTIYPPFASELCSGCFELIMAERERSTVSLWS
jgi:hypothetical protein